MRGAVAIIALVGACGGASADKLAPAHWSAERHRQEAARLDRLAADNVLLAEQAARAEGRVGEPIHCLDQPLAGITYSGGEPTEVLRPCWTSIIRPSEHYAERARRHRERASWHRARADALLATEQLACAGLGEQEIATSPFARREDIVRVDSYREAGRLRGARVVFRHVPGLDAAWMHRSLHCHYARAAALGFPRDYMSFCPVTLPEVRIAVVDEPEGIVVIIAAQRDELAAAVLGRATDLTVARAP